MRTKYLFFADSELKVFLSEQIASQYCQDGEHHFLTFTPAMKRTWGRFPWASRTCMEWPHRVGLLKKYYNMRSRLHGILQTVGDLSTGADRVVIHTYQIFSERINYLFSYLRRRYPKIDIRVRLVPDGTLNLTRRPMEGLRKVPQLINRVKWLGDPLIHSYRYSGDRLGADAEIVDRIYLPRGFPHEYDPAKVCWVDMPSVIDPQREQAGRPKRALVIGTALVQTCVCTPEDQRAAAACIREHLDAAGVEQADYKPHLKEPEDCRELWSPGYRVLDTECGVERLLLSNAYDLIVGQCSTAMINAKLMSPGTEVVSCGLDVVETRSRKGASVLKYRDVCEKLGISLLPAEPYRETVRRAA